MKLPTLSDVTASWHALPAETRDLIGIIAIDYVFQGLLFGDRCAPEDRAVLDPTIRDAACDAENRRLNELTKVIENSLPDLFGPDGENPAWSDNAGPVPTPAALAAAATEAAELAEHKRRERSLRIRLGRKGFKLWREHGAYVVTVRGRADAQTDHLDLDGIEAWLAGHREARDAAA